MRIRRCCLLQIIVLWCASQVSNSDESTIIAICKGDDSCYGDDCQVSVECPSGMSILGCVSDPPDDGDGVTPRQFGGIAKCVAHTGPKAVAICSSVPSKVVQSSEEYLDEQDVEAKCPPGYIASACLCQSLWGMAYCSGTSSFRGSGDLCSKYIPTSPGRRRRGAGARIYAICVPVDSEESLTSSDLNLDTARLAYHVEVAGGECTITADDTVGLASGSCSKDDCMVKSDCPASTSVVACQTHPPDSGDGAFANTSSACWASSAGQKTSAAALCSSWVDTVTVSSGGYEDAQLVFASCPIDYSAVVSCNCKTAWQVSKICGGQAGFEPWSDRCSMSIPESPGRRRRGSGASIHAICGRPQRGLPLGGRFEIDWDGFAQDVQKYISTHGGDEPTSSPVEPTSSPVYSRTSKEAVSSYEPSGDDGFVPVLIVFIVLGITGSVVALFCARRMYMRALVARAASAADGPSRVAPAMPSLVSEEGSSHVHDMGPLPVYWTNARCTREFDQMVYVRRDLQSCAQELMNATHRPISTQDRPCPKNTCPATPGGCRCVQPGADPGMPTSYLVRRVIRVEDSAMWYRYSQRRDAIRQKHVGEEFRTLDPPAMTSDITSRHTDMYAALDGSLNEVYLWHGTHVRHALNIAQNDFRLNLAGSSTGTMYGRGLYFAEASSKADEYAKDEPGGHYDGVYTLLLCRVCLGKMYYTTRRDEEAYEKGQNLGCDSTCGDRTKSAKTYRELVVYDNDQVYPEFIVLYTRRFAGDDAEKTRIEERDLFHMELPVYWLNCHENPRDKQFHLQVSVRRETRELLQKLVDASTQTYAFVVNSARRVEDSKMWNRYANFKRALGSMGVEFVPPNELDGDAAAGYTLTSQVLRDGALLEQAISVDNLEGAVNEHLLWHGTSRQAAESIATQGFRIGINATHGSRFGKGAYFAEDLDKSVTYCSDGYYVLLCRVISGQMFYTEASIDTSAHEKAKQSGMHSVLANPDGKGPREFVVWEEQQVYPEFILELSLI